VLYANTCDNKINETNNKLTSIEENLQQLADTQLRLSDEIHALNEDNLHQQLNALQSQRTSTEHALSVARQEIETIMHHLRETENTRLACEHQTHKIKDEINQIRLKVQAATIVLNNWMN
jgi:chromosome segregation ATPase